VPGDDGPENSGGVTHSSALATAAKDANIKRGEIAAFILSLCTPFQHQNAIQLQTQQLH
jgi:hypothetical protein